MVFVVVVVVSVFFLLSLVQLCLFSYEDGVFHSTPQPSASLLVKDLHWWNWFSKMHVKPAFP